MADTAACVVLHNAVVVTMDGTLRVFRWSHRRRRRPYRGRRTLRRHPRRLPPCCADPRPWWTHRPSSTHVHTSQQLAKGIADDVDLMTFLHERIWPYESHMTEDSYASTLLCGIELIHSGVTCFAEAGGQFVSEMARAVELLGLRACLTKSTMDCGDGLPPNWSCSTDDCIQSQKELYEKHHNTADGRIRIWFGSRQIMNVTDRLLVETRDAAQKLDTGIHMHVAEIPYENQFIMGTKGIDHGTVTYLEKIDFLRSNLLAAHSVLLNEPQIGHFSKAGVKVSHCPASNMRLSGFAPIREMLESGVCVSLLVQIQQHATTE
ncbi:hypothetical protein ACP4OV_007880 [Aristida adscensionis]